MTDTEETPNVPAVQDAQIYYNMDIEEYHDHPSISNSGLGLIAKAPRYYQYEKFEKPAEERAEQKQHFVMGSAYHSLLLERELFKGRFYIWSGRPRNTKAGKEEYDKALKEAQGRQLLKQDEMDDLLAMTTSTIGDQNAKNYIGMDGGIVESSIIWTDPIYDIQCRIRMDLIFPDHDIVVDFKSVADASPEAFERSVYNFGYDRQGYFYGKGYEALTGREMQKFVLICCEKKEPFLTGVYIMSQVALMSGQMRTERLLETYADCKKRDYWPSYNGGQEAEISIPGWAAYRMEHDGANEGVSA